MIHHIALTINDFDDLINFYEKVLAFNLHHRFGLDAALSKTIFDIEEKTEVVVMRLRDMELELFISNCKAQNAYSHVCLKYYNSELIYKKAQEASYRTFVKPRDGHDAYFIWDKSGNLFEIKELNEDEARLK
ncbi:MAG TPA: VOC family protein [Prolixibacteraceae bacterium]|nr:VOC family protein [Prolixibacteraceae bacterium]